MPIGRLPELFTLYGSNDLDLICFWEIPGSTRKGHHHIVGIFLGVQQPPLQPSAGQKNLGRALFAQTEREKTALLNNLLRNRHLREENPVKAVVELDDRLQHDFDKER